MAMRKKEKEKANSFPPSPSPWLHDGHDRKFGNGEVRAPKEKKRGYIVWKPSPEGSDSDKRARSFSFPFPISVFVRPAFWYEGGLLQPQKHPRRQGTKRRQKEKKNSKGKKRIKHVCMVLHVTSGVGNDA